MYKQASYLDRLSKKARVYWSPALAKLGLASEWVVAKGDIEQVDAADDVDDDSDIEEGSGKASGPNSDLDTDDFDLFELED
jgi:hypothetical protein